MKVIGAAVETKKNIKDPNRGFKMDISGKLIIEEPKRGSNNKQSDSDSENDNIDEEIKKKKIPTDESDGDDEVAENSKAKSRKRKASSSLSQASGKTGASTKYVAGGTGIHRPLSVAASRYSNVSGKTDVSKKSTAYGSDYRAKKSKGDMKKKGALDPYAYISLSRNSLNKRKRAKSSGQFKNIVQGARKGAAAGSKRRKV